MLKKVFTRDRVRNNLAIHRIYRKRLSLNHLRSVWRQMTACNHLSRMARFGGVLVTCAASKNNR